MSAELQAEISRLTAELQKISRIWDIAHEFQERHIARMEEENRGQRAEIIELKAQRDCDWEAIANYERMVGDHQGRAAAEVERLTGERNDWKRNGHIYLAEIIRKNEERISIAEKLAKAAQKLYGGGVPGWIPVAGDIRNITVLDGDWTAFKQALDAFISSGSAERWACKTCGDTAIVARDANSKICWKCPSCMAMCSTPGDCDMEPECSFRPLSPPDHPTPPAQPSKDLVERTHICGDPNEACDMECVEKAAEFDENRPPIAVLDATEPALVEEEREMAPSAAPVHEPCECYKEDYTHCAYCREEWPCETATEKEVATQAPPKDHARVLAEAARDILNNRECSCFRGIPGHSVATGVCQRCVVSFNLLAEALADYERAASGPGAGEGEKA